MNLHWNVTGRIEEAWMHGVFFLLPMQQIYHRRMSDYYLRIRRWENGKNVRLKHDNIHCLLEAFFSLRTGIFRFYWVFRPHLVCYNTANLNIINIK